MYKLDPIHPVQSAIIETLAERQGLNVKELFEDVTRTTKVEVSRQNLYRVVAQLIDNGILQKANGRLSLKQEWVSRFLRVADSMRFNYGSQESAPKSLPKRNGERMEFQADSLMSLDLVWIDILFRFLQETKERSWYAYNSHPWYAVGSLDTEHHFFERLMLRGVSVFLVYGNDSFLDRYGLNLISLTGFKTAISTTTQLASEGYALWACGPYILEVTIPEELNKHFTYFFNSVSAVEQFNPDFFSQIFRMRAKCSLSVEYNAERSRKLQKKLLKCF